MSLAPGPSPSVNRGDVILQPNFFTSSLFVDPLREDISALLSSSCATFKSASTPAPPAADTSELDSAADGLVRPFELFKGIWDEQGWKWLHFKVFDTRTRRTFINIVCRLFLERTTESEPVESRAAALFALYMFYSTQPESSFPPMQRVEYLNIPIDTYKSLLGLPGALKQTLNSAPLAAYCSHIILALSPRFTILPKSQLGPYIPRSLPREQFVPDMPDAAEIAEGGDGQDVPKKKGRPTKKEALRRTRAATAGLSKWLDTTAVPDGSDSMHIMTSSAPSALRAAYIKDKEALLDILGDEEGKQALTNANRLMLGRLRVIDERAAARGMEVGSEGGERTGMGRAERAVSELGRSELERRGGLLGLMEGAGIGAEEP